MVITWMNYVGTNKIACISKRNPMETLVPCVRSGDCLCIEQDLSGS